MNPNVVVAVAAIILGLIGQWGLIAYYAGRQTKTVESLGEKIEDVDIAVTKRMDGHSTWIKEIVKTNSEATKDLDGRLIRVEERLKIGG
jgi:hypothetical protein